MILTPKPYLTDRFIKINLIANIFFQLLIWLIIIRQIRFFSEFINLRYNIYFGINLVGEWYRLFWLPAVGLLIFLLNVILAILFLEREKLLSYYLIGSSTFIQILILLATVALLAINR